MELLWTALRKSAAPVPTTARTKSKPDVETLVYKVRSFDSEEAAVDFVRREYMIHQA